MALVGLFISLVCALFCFAIPLFLASYLVVHQVVHPYLKGTRIKCHLPLKSKFLIPGKAIVEEAGAFIVSQTAGGRSTASTSSQEVSCSAPRERFQILRLTLVLASVHNLSPFIESKHTDPGIIVSIKIPSWMRFRSRMTAEMKILMKAMLHLFLCPAERYRKATREVHRKYDEL
uniref:Uncharacterized protein n=1 Tax=Vitis vinifera TaxID=29760 RepID=A5AWS3_VITVI|nr:hypothetical protein VITISV_012007 [Vitis vinifera]